MTRVRERFESDRKEAATVNREFLDWLSQRPQPGRPYFAFLNYFDAHSPYQLSPRRVHRFGVKPSDEREYRLIQDWWTMDKSRVTPEQLAFVFNAYDDCVASIDEQVGRLFDELGRRKALDRTWVILVSDHGESFGEHAGVFLHGSSLYRTEVHVPLVVVPPPGTPIRPVVAETVSLRDLAATIADLAGQGADSPFPGAIAGPSSGGRRPARRPATDRRGGAGRTRPERDPRSQRAGPVPTALAAGRADARAAGATSAARARSARSSIDLREDPREQHDVAGRRRLSPPARADAQTPCRG